MIIDLGELEPKYGKLEIDDENIIGIIQPKEFYQTDYKKLIIDSLENPIGKEKFSDFLNNKEKILVIINDYTRPTPTEKVLEIINEYTPMHKLGFIMALGTHRVPKEGELKAVLGKFYSTLRYRLKYHDCKDESKLIFKGESNRGTPIYINKIVYEYDGIIVIGSSEPHYFAGYTGGRKAFIPGLAGFETISKNHKFAMSPESKTLELDGNPVHEDMMDIIDKLNIREKVFSIQTVVDKDKRICFACSGDLVSSFNSIVNHVNQIYTVPVSEKADIIIAIVSEPMDVNLYQSHKALENAKLCLKENGIIVLISRCITGVGSDGFYNFLKESKSPDEAILKSSKSFDFGNHKAYKFAELLTHADVYIVSELSDDIVKNVFMVPFKTVQRAYNKAIEVKGKNSRILVIKDAGVTIPILNSKSLIDIGG